MTRSSRNDRRAVRPASVSDVLVEPAPVEQVEPAPGRPKLSAITHYDLLMNGRAVDINTGGVWTRDPDTDEVSYDPPRRAR